MTFLLKVTDRGEVHVPFANAIIAVELLTIILLSQMCYQLSPLTARCVHEEPLHVFMDKPHITQGLSITTTVLLYFYD